MTSVYESEDIKHERKTTGDTGSHLRISHEYSGRSPHASTAISISEEGEGGLTKRMKLTRISEPNPLGGTLKYSTVTQRTTNNVRTYV
jgi:hypothetical protein